MSNNGWFTVKDVLNDLEEVTGRRIQDFDNRFAVSGESPPPVNIPDEEDDYLLMYKGCISNDTTRAKPDIVGIKHMLRMVNDYFDDSTCDDNGNIKELKNNANTVLSISKLNPNVPEFVPREVPSTRNEVQGSKAQIKESGSSEISAAEEQKTESMDGLNLGIIKRNAESIDTTNSCITDLEYSVGCEPLVCKDNIKTNKTDATHETNSNDIDVNKRIDISALNSEEIKNMRENLKLKISSTSKADCLRKKKEKNLAIVSLLKLYSEIPPHSTGSKSVELMTPDYFKIVPKDNLKAVNDCPDTFEAQRNKQNNENNKIVPNGKSGNIKICESQNNVDYLPCVPQTSEESSLKSTSPTNQSKKEKNDSSNAVTCKRKGTKSVSQIIDISEMPTSALTSDSFKISSDKNKITLTDIEQCKTKELSLKSKSTNLKKMKHEGDDVQDLLEQTPHFTQESNLNPTDNSRKTDFSIDIPASLVLEQRMIDHSMSVEVKESIKKVNNWLQPKKSKQPLLGPVTFKRKDNVSVPKSANISESPSSGSVPDSLDMSEKSSSGQTSTSFVPTSYADELTKRYMKQSKAKEDRCEDIWSKLERELKEKDKAIKEKINHEIQHCL